MKKIKVYVVIFGMFAGDAYSNGNTAKSTGSSDNDISIEERKARFEAFIKEVAASNRNDEITQLARQHVKTRSKIEQYRQEKAHYDRMAKIYKKRYEEEKTLESILGFYRDRYPTPCGMQIGKTTRKEALKKFSLPENNKPDGTSIYLCSNELPKKYQKYIKNLFIAFEPKSTLVRCVDIYFNDDYANNFILKIQKAGYRRISYVNNGIVFQQKQMPVEIIIRNSISKNLTSVDYSWTD